MKVIKCFDHWSDGPSYSDLPTLKEGEVAYCMQNWRWRVAHLYTVIDKTGQVVPFVPNGAQRRFMDDLHSTDIILKARQLGFSTLIQLIILDTCMFNPNFSAGTITITMDDGKKLLREKILGVYDRMPAQIRDFSPLTSRSATRVEFANGSSITVGISLRGGTYNLLHVSELGKISARFPERAREIRSGAFNTIAPGQHIFVESTAEGRNYFYDLCNEALHRGRDPEEGEFKAHFFPWDTDPAYKVESSMDISRETKVYFNKLSRETGRIFSRAQIAWYQRKKAQQGHEMLREFPSTPDEAFAASVEGAIFKDEIARIHDQHRIGPFPYEAALGPVYVGMDIGVADHTVLLLAQRVTKSQFNVFDAIYNHSKSIDWYLDEMAKRKQRLRFNWGVVALPHDGSQREFMSNETREEAFRRGLPGAEVVVVPRAKTVAADIEHVRAFLEGSTWNQVANPERDPLLGGAGHVLAMAQTYRWDQNADGVFVNRPKHDEASHYADAIRTMAKAWTDGLLDVGSDMDPVYHTGNLGYDLGGRSLGNWQPEENSGYL